MIEFSLSEKQFSSLFPYYISLNKDGIIESCGKDIPHSCNVFPGAKLSETFSYTNTAETLLPIGDEVIIQSRHNTHIFFRGRFEQMQGNEMLVFIGTPYSFENEHDNQKITPHITFLNDLHTILKDNKVEDTDWQRVSRDFILSSRNFDVTEYLNNEYAITVSDESGNVLWCNTRFQQLSERDFDEIKGKRPRDSIYGRHSMYIDNSYVDNNIKKGEPFYFENIGTSKYGREFWLGATVQAIYNTKGDIIGRIHFVKDISDRKVKDLELEENENLLKLAVEAAKAGLWAYDISGNVFKVSEEYKKILGYDVREEITVQQVEAMIHPDDLERLNNVIHPGLSRENPNFIFEHRMKVNDEYRYFNAKASCITFNSEGKPLKVVGTLRDVTIEKNQMLELEKQKQFFHKILNEIPADIAIFSPDHKYLYLNKLAIKNEELREWMIGKDDFDYCKLKNIDTKLATDRRLRFNSIVSRKEHVRFTESKVVNGITEHILRVFYPVINNNGEVEQVIGYATDITEQVENEKYAQLQEKRIRNFLDISSDGIFRCSADGELKLYNQSLLRITNLPSSGGNLFDIVADNDVAEVMEKVAELIRSGDQQRGMFNLKRKFNEEPRFIDYTFIASSRGIYAEFSGRLSDVTEVIMKEKNLQKTIDDEILLNKYKTQFMHITSHELRTPLTIIQSNAEILQLCFEHPELLKKKDPSVLVSRVIKEVSMMTDILNQLMLVSSIEQGGMEVNKKTIDVKQFIEHNIINLYRPNTDGRNLEVRIDDNVELWDFEPTIVRYALINLIGNAFKYSSGRPAPKLVVFIAGGRLTFRVTDYGIGIPPADISKVFQSFFRATNVGVVSGTGIGLMVVDYAAKKHNGTTTLTSELNKGSIFNFIIPE